jgi:hypothetical protein
MYFLYNYKKEAFTTGCCFGCWFGGTGDPYQMRWVNLQKPFRVWEDKDWLLFICMKSNADGYDLDRSISDY